MNLFFTSRKKNIAFGSLLKTDMHSHILPGIDDGAADVESSLLLIDGLIRNGYERLIATPHIMSDHYANTPETILAALRKLQAAMDERGYTIPVEAAAEYMMDDHFEEIITNGDILTFRGNHVLVETFFQSLPPNFHELLFQLKIKNYRIVLAHPERYHYLHENLTFLEELKDQGVFLQCNALSFTGYYGKKEKMMAEKMLDASLIDFVGTDMHHQRHLKALEGSSISRKIIQKLESIQLNNL